MNTPLPRLDQGEHAALALRFIGRFVWLRAAELGRLLHPGRPHARKYAEKHLRKLLELRLVVARPLPGRDAGTAYVLSTRGAQYLNDWNAGQLAYTYRAGTDWGTSSGGRWEPPRSWRHDLLSTGVLACLRERGWSAWPEPQLRHRVPLAAKHPDGLLRFDVPDGSQKGVWLEVENARKSGRNIEQLARAVLRAALGRPVYAFPEMLADTPIRHGMVAIDPNARDERGRRLDHLKRLQSALRKVPMVDGTEALVHVAWLTFRGVGVESISLEVFAFRWPEGRFVSVGRERESEPQQLERSAP